MKDVAELAGVSVQTVSRVVNQEKGITPQTMRRVSQAIASLGYRPHGVARSLRTGKTQTIALLVPNIGRPFFASMTEVVERVVEEAGYSLVVYSTRDDPTREARYLHLIAQNRVDGVLFVTTDYSINVSFLSESGIPAVAIDRQPLQYDGPAALIDNYASGALAAQHLLDLGHRRIALIEGAMQLVYAQQQVRGMRAALEAQRLTLQLAGVASNLRGCPRGYYGALLLLAGEPHPTAIIASDDNTALGAMRYLAEQGLRVPDQMSIMAMNDMEYALYTSPSLTTIGQPVEEMVVRAMHILQQWMAGEMPSEPQVTLTPHLQQRDSTASPAAGG